MKVNGYEITKQIRIHNTEEDWDYVLTTDEYGTVTVLYHEGVEAFSGKTITLDIPKNCIQHVIDSLEKLK